MCKAPASIDKNMMRKKDQNPRTNMLKHFANYFLVGVFCLQSAFLTLQLAGLGLLAACSSTERMRPPALSEQGQVIVVTESPEKPLPLNPETRKNVKPISTPILPLADSRTDSAVASEGSEALAAIALVGMAVGISQVYREHGYNSDLNGSCAYGEPDSTVQSPCRLATVNLLDEKNGIAASSSTNQQGQFRFFIPEGQTFFVQIVDRKGRSATTKMKVGRSDFVSLFLK